jgi:hypothetical protein
MAAHMLRRRVGFIGRFPHPVFPRPPAVKRQFFDANGVSWDVWDVSPQDLSRVDYDRRATARTQGDVPRAFSASVYPELREGWLCFQSALEKRRFAPIPPEWHELPDGVLRVMLEVATPAPAAEPMLPRPTTNE